MLEEGDISYIKLLISKGKTKEAIEVLLQKTDLDEKALLISSRFEELERRYISNLISTEDRNVERSKIENSILRLFQLQKKPPLENSRSRPLLLKPQLKNKKGLLLIILTFSGIIISIIISNLSSSEFDQVAEGIENVDQTTSDKTTVSQNSTQKTIIDEENSKDQLFTDSVTLFTTEYEKIELALNDFLSTEDIPNNRFDRLISTKEYELALQVLQMAEERDSSKKPWIMDRRKSILLMKRDSFDNVWFSFPGDFILTIRNNKEGLYDRDGNELFEPQFDEIDPVTFDYLYCTKLGEKYGVIDQSGKELFKPQFDDMYIFSPHGLICTEKDGKYGIISEKGEEIYPPVFSDLELEEFAMSIIKVKRNGKYGFLDSNGVMILETNITSVDQVWAETLFINIGNKWGVIDLQGRFKLEVDYDILTYEDDFNIIVAEKNGKKLYFTDSGKPTENPLRK